MLSRITILFIILTGVAARAEDADPCQNIQNLSPNIFPATELDQLKKSGATLRWARVEATSKYHILISRNEDFSGSKKFEKWDNLLPVRVFPNQTYYWKVQAYDLNKKTLSCPMKTPFQFIVEGEVSTGAATSALAVTEAPTETASSAEVEARPALPEAVAPLAIEKDKVSSQFIPAEENKIRISETENSTPAATAENHEVFDFKLAPRVSLDTSVSLLKFRQNNEEIGSVSSSGVLFPSLGISAQSRNYGRFYFSGHFKQTSGKFSTDTGDVSLVDSQFQWQRFGANAYMQISKPWAIYIGLEQITTPYFYALSPSIMTLKAINQTNGVVGVNFDFYKTEKWSYQIGSAYSLPIAAKGDGLTTAKISGTQLDFHLTALHYNERGMFWGGGLIGFYRHLTQQLNSGTFVSSGNATTTQFGLNLSGGFLF